MFCQDCKNHLGPTCSGYHRKSVAFQRHLQVPILMKTSAESSRFTKRPRSCETHPGLEQSTYCMKCEDAVCAKCAAGEHLGHSLKPYSDVARDRIQSFTSILSAKKEQARGVTRDIDETLRALKTQSSEVVEQIEQNFAALTKLLDQHRRNLVQQVGGKKDLLQAAVLREKASLEKTLEDIEKFKASSAMILSGGTPSQLVDFEQEVS